jgi:hypothetical protein
MPSDRLTIVQNQLEEGVVPKYKPISKKEPWWKRDPIYQYAGTAIFILLSLMIIIILMHFMKRKLVGGSA